MAKKSRYFRYNNTNFRVTHYSDNAEFGHNFVLYEEFFNNDKPYWYPLDIDSEFVLIVIYNMCANTNKKSPLLINDMH